MFLNGVLTLAALLAVATTAQKPTACVSPPLMSGGISVAAANGLIMSSGTVNYDAFGERMRVRNFGFSGNASFALDQLMLFKQKVYFEIDWGTMSCQKRALDAAFTPMRVPEDAKLMGSVVLGSSSSWGMGVLTNTWYGDLPGKGHYMTVFTEVGCIPLTSTSFTPGFGWTAVSTYNWVLGTSNPMDFFPPEFCRGSKVDPSEAPDTVFSALESLAMKTRAEE